MSFTALRERMRQAEKDAMVIFDEEEPVGQPTDLVMPRRRWFRRKPRSTAPERTTSSR